MAKRTVATLYHMPLDPQPVDRHLPPAPPPGSTPRGSPRPCSKCGRRFQPTIVRRLLCGGCWSTTRTTSDGIGDPT